MIEGIVNDTIIKHLERNGILHHSQHGYQSSRYVDKNLLQSYNLVTYLINKGIPVDVALAKAFDRVCHRRPIVKLHTAEIYSQIVGWIKPFLDD